jgi:membrane-associated phospholipid phosphatase
MNCPFNESKIKMNDDDFMRKLNSQSIQSSPSDFDTQYFTPSKLSDEQAIGVKKSCPCSNGGNGNDNNMPSDGNIIGDIKGKAGELMDSFISMFKTIAGKNDIYKAVSVYEFYISLVALLLILSTQNTFIGILLLGLYSRQIPEVIIKVFLSRSGDNELRNWAKRPEGAKDCNMFNAGGEYSNDSGLISSHTFLISTLMFYFVYKFTNNFKYGMNYKQYIFVGLLLLWSIVVALARIRLGCHKQHQTIIGFFLGMIWGYVLYIVIEMIKNKIPRIEEDEQKIMRLFEVEN